MTHIDAERMKRLKAMTAKEEEPAPVKKISMRDKLELALATAQKSVNAQLHAEENAAIELVQSTTHSGVGGETLRELLERASKGNFKPNSPLGGTTKSGFSAAEELEKLKKIKELADKAAAHEREAAIQAYAEATKQGLIKESEPEPERPDSFGSWA